MSTIIDDEMRVRIEGDLKIVEVREGDSWVEFRRFSSLDFGGLEPPAKSHCDHAPSRRPTRPRKVPKKRNCNIDQIAATCVKPKIDFYRKTIDSKCHYWRREGRGLVKMKLICRTDGKDEELGTLLRYSGGFGHMRYLSGPGVDNFFRAWSGGAPPKNKAALERIGLKEDCIEECPQ
jgi:hypothetical protein